MGRVGWVPWAIFIIAVPLFLITASVTWAFNSPGLYNDGFEKYSISRISGITDADLRQVGADIRGYINSGDEPLHVHTRILGTEQELFNDREIAHMKDVKRLVWGVYILALASAVYLAVMTSIGFARHRGRFVEPLAKRAAYGGGLTLALLAVFGILAVVDFESIFIKFHQLSFANDFWQLDPRTDYLVRIFPDDFWLDATVWVAVRTIAGAVALTVAGGAYLVYRRYAGWQKALKGLESAR
ncbi:MAG: TIGR01906 family membrane protein [Chloroflexi bacterium]|nr:TIGR01906 family membrane protein [Chloroflexota bacterium]MCI0902355.1 TIGR01906 family membrane protein [Chloroflexota bacterium]